MNDEFYTNSNFQFSQFTSFGIFFFFFHNKLKEGLYYYYYFFNKILGKQMLAPLYQKQIK